MTRRERLHRADGNLYRSAHIDKPDSGVALGEGLVVRFALGGDQPITLLDLGACRRETLAEVVGESAASRLIEGADRVDIEGPRSWALLTASRLAQALGLLRLPVARTHRFRWRAQAVVAAGDLLDQGFDTEGPLSEQGLALLGDLDRMGPAGLDAIRSRPSVITALVRLDATFDLALAARRVLDDLLDDLPAPDLDVMAQLEATRSEPGQPVVEQSPVRTRPALQLAPEWLGAGERQLPMFWQLVREDLLPQDHGFDGAVTVGFDNGMARIEVAAHPGSAEVLFVRIVGPGGELRSVDVLRPSNDRWLGDIALPEDFDRWSERFEIVDSLSRPVIAGPDEVLADQRELVELAWSLLDADA